ncbi:MAG: ABC transporter permease [Saprospiraceae bacterium]|nr:ABC transporter permease [Saprospiraceae bacterium]
MEISSKLAVRYIFGKKSTNVINIISAIAVFGIAVGTAALIIVLSVFNGFEDLISGLFQKFNPDLKVTPVQGKTFPLDSTVLLKLKKINGVDKISATLEDLALFDYQNSQTFGKLKGVDSNYAAVTSIADNVVEGVYSVKPDDPPPVVLGAGLAQRLAADIEDKLAYMRVYTPKRVNRSPLETPFSTRFINPVGVFSIQQEFDQEYAITDLDFARQIFQYTDEVSAYEIKLDSSRNLSHVRNQIANVLGKDFEIKDRFQQDEAFLKLMNIEKWMSYAIVCLTLLLVSFNMIGALWMIVLDKQRDISILKSLGLRDRGVTAVFIRSGMLLCTLGLLVGFILAIVLYILQKEVGLVTIPEGFVVETYPISLRFIDFVTVGVTVLIIGWLSSIPAARKASRIKTSIIE